MPLAFRYVRLDGFYVGLDSSDVKEFVSIDPSFEDGQTRVPVYGYVCATLDGLAAIIRRVHTAAVAGLAVDCDQALQREKKVESTFGKR